MSAATPKAWIVGVAMLVLELTAKEPMGTGQMLPPGAAMAGFQLACSSG